MERLYIHLETDCMHAQLYSYISASVHVRMHACESEEYGMDLHSLSCYGYKLIKELIPTMFCLLELRPIIHAKGIFPTKTFKR